MAVRLGLVTGTLDLFTHVSTVPEALDFQAVAGDFNHDGVPDVATANFSFDSVSVFLGAGDGSLHDAGQFPAGVGPSALATGDFNGDGIADLVTNGGTDRVDVLLAQGDGTFQRPVVTPVGFTPTYFAVGDFNGDGVLDLAIGNPETDPQTGSVAILLGDGHGRFGTVAYTTTLSAPSGLAAGDFDGDTSLDLAVADQNDDSVTVFSNRGPEGFVAGQPLPVGGGPFSLVAGDFDRNGLCDLATANLDGNTVSVLLNEPDGFMDAATYDVGRDPQQLIAVDTNGDGLPDLATVNFFDDTVSLLVNQGGGTFPDQSTDFAAGSRPVALAAADLDRDGRQDLVTVNQGGIDLTVLAGQASGGLGASRRLDLGLAERSQIIADLNGDGLPDIASTDARRVSIETDINQGDFLSSGTVSTGDGLDHVAVAAADFNEDGRLDLAVANTDRQDVVVLLGNGDGTFRPDTTVPVNGIPTALATGDFNGDGSQDLVVTESGSADVHIYYGDGTGHFRDGGRFGVHAAPVALVAMDLNGDGLSDLVVADAGSDDVAVLLGSRAGVSCAFGFFAAGAAPTTLVVRDLDGDGTPDLAAADADSSEVCILLGDGHGGFRAGGTSAVNLGPVSLAAGDFNGDRRIDLAVGNKIVPGVSLLLGQGDGTFRLQRAFETGNNPLGLAAADFNGDGTLDLASVDPYSPDFGLNLGVGDGTFFGSRQLLTPVQATPLVGDLNGDQAADVAVLRRDGRILVRFGLPNQSGGFGSSRIVNPPAAAGGASSDFPARDAALVNRNGRTDVVALDALDGDLSFYSFDGTSGTFAPRGAGPHVPGALPVRLTVGDLTGDGRQDILVAALASDEVFVFLQGPDGEFGADPSYTLHTGVAPTQVTLADMDGDGRMDVVVANQFSGDVSIFLNSGTAPFANEERFRAGTGPYKLGQLLPTAPSGVMDTFENLVAVAAAPFTAGSAGPDLIAVERRTRTLTLLRNDGGGGVYDPGTPLALVAPGASSAAPVAVVAGAFGANLPPGLAVLDLSTDQLLVFRDDGAGHFLFVQALPAGTAPSGLTAADANGDGKLDLLVGNIFGDVLVSPGNGDGTFSPPPPFAGNHTGLAVVAGGPGTPAEALVADQQTNTVTAQSQPADRLGFTTDETLPSNVQDPAPADGTLSRLEGPGGSLDAIVAMSGANEILVYHGSGTDAAGSPVFDVNHPLTFTVGSEPVSVAVGELNNDNVPDLLVSNEGSNDISIIFGSIGADGQWAGTPGPRLGSGGTGPLATMLRDENGDGIPDLVVTNQGGTVTVLPGRGQGFFDDRSPQVLTLPGTPTGPPVPVGPGGDFAIPTAGGSVAGLDLNTLTTSLLFDPGTGPGVDAIAPLPNGDIAAVEGSGSAVTVEEFRLEDAGLVSVAGFDAHEPGPDGAPPDPSDLEVLETAAGPEVLVTSAGQDTIFVYLPHLETQNEHVQPTEPGGNGPDFTLTPTLTPSVLMPEHQAPVALDTVPAAPAAGAEAGAETVQSSDQEGSGAAREGVEQSIGGTAAVGGSEESSDLVSAEADTSESGIDVDEQLRRLELPRPGQPDLEEPQARKTRTVPDARAALPAGSPGWDGPASPFASCPDAAAATAERLPDPRPLSEGSVTPDPARARRPVGMYPADRETQPAVYAVEALSQLGWGVPATGCDAVGGDWLEGRDEVPVAAGVPSEASDFAQAGDAIEACKLLSAMVAGGWMLAGPLAPHDGPLPPLGATGLPARHGTRPGAGVPPG